MARPPSKIDTRSITLVSFIGIVNATDADRCDRNFETVCLVPNVVSTYLTFHIKAKTSKATDDNILVNLLKSTAMEVQQLKNLFVHFSQIIFLLYSGFVEIPFHQNSKSVSSKM